MATIVNGNKEQLLSPLSPAYLTRMSREGTELDFIAGTNRQQNSRKSEQRTILLFLRLLNVIGSMRMSIEEENEDGRLVYDMIHDCLCFWAAAFQDLTQPDSLSERVLELFESQDDYLVELLYRTLQIMIVWREEEVKRNLSLPPIIWV